MALLLTLAAQSGHAVEAVELGGWLGPSGALWRTPASAVVTGAFTWADASHTLARAPAGTCTFLGLKVWEATLRVKDDRTAGLEAVLYQRGDGGELSREAFATQVQAAASAVARWAGGPGQKLTDELQTAGVKREALGWKLPGQRVRLVASHSTKDRAGTFAFRAEYLRVAVEPVVPAGAPVAAGRPLARPGATRAPETRSNGDVVLTGVPMVDQGEKGYCSVATLERITRYYGLAIDQHELAQLGASDPSAGTDGRHLMASLQRVGPRIGLKARTLDEMTVDEAVRLIDRYNREARRADRPEITAGRMIDLGAVYQKMETALLKEARNKDGGGRKAMLSDIQKAVGEGVPLVWAVALGKVAERPALRQAAGGHMRLLTGYNAKTGEVLYSDSWGPGHEEKRMALEDAWAISLGRYRIEPR